MYEEVSVFTSVGALRLSDWSLETLRDMARKQSQWRECFMACLCDTCSLGIAETNRKIPKYVRQKHKSIGHTLLRFIFYPLGIGFLYNFSVFAVTPCLFSSERNIHKIYLWGTFYTIQLCVVVAGLGSLEAEPYFSRRGIDWFSHLGNYISPRCLYA